jgi:drug/metabolite transporter (DMT)-like permease
MQDSTRKKVGRVMAYTAGCLLIFLGTTGLLVESSHGRPSSTNFKGYVDAVVIIVSGALTCVATRSHYGGGPWSFCGLILVAAAVGRLAFALQVYTRGAHFFHPERFYWMTAALWGAGCYCLVWGHIRCRRAKENCFHGTG